MKKLKVKEKMKKLFLIVIAFVTIAFMMPVQTRAEIIGDFIDLILHIPDGVMGVIGKYIGGYDEMTIKELHLYEETSAYKDAADGALYNFTVTPQEIFTSGIYEEDEAGNYYTKLGIFDINFFSDRKIVSDTPIVSSQILAPVIGNIYVLLRNLALVLMMLVVLYIGIKIMISSIAAQQAKYKQLLVDWLVGFALLFMMHYIMSGIVSLNTMVVKLLKNSEGDTYYVGLEELGEIPVEWDWEHPIKSTARKYVQWRYNTAKWIVDKADWWTGGKILGTRALDQSKWYNVALGHDTDGKTLDPRYLAFLEERVVIRNSSDPSETFSNYLSESLNNGEPAGRIKLKDVLKGTDSIGELGYITPGNGIQQVSWGDDGIIDLSASIYTHKEYSNKAIVRLNMMSYIRTISSYGLDCADSVKLYSEDGENSMNYVDVMGFAILYVALVIETIMFAFTYIKRVLQMSFLTMVAPIVAIMYPIDKIGDGKAQAFNTWFKDYLFNVLIQPMHLLLYTIFIVAASELSQKNIIYAIAVYGFMIPSEKYFKKILGFEKGGSTGGGGPMSQALGRSLAMDGLGKLTGLGPAGRHGNGGGSSGSNRRAKVGKNEASNINPMSGMNPLSGGDSGTGTESTSPRTQTSRQSGNRARGFNPMARPGSRQGPLTSAGRVLRRRISRAATGGRYSSLATPGALGAVGGNIIKHGARGITRAAGIAGIGATGLIAGAATAIATGDVNNVWKGAVTGVAAGNKLSSNIYDSVYDAGSAFKDEVDAERAANDEEFNKDYQQNQTFELLDEDLAECNVQDRREYTRIIKKYAAVTNLDSMDKVKALRAIENEYDNNRGAFTGGLVMGQDTGAKALKFAQRYKNVLTDPDKVLQSLKNHESYSDDEAEDMLKLITAAYQAMN